MGDENGLPGDFSPVNGCVPEWIDVNAICSEAKRYVGLYIVNGFNVVAINNGRSIYTTEDRGGEFRRRFDGIRKNVGFDQPPQQEPVLVYDCKEHREWIAPRQSAVQFLFGQF